jgi:hypothetical protein
LLGTETLNLNAINQDKKEPKDSKEEERGIRKDIGTEEHRNNRIIHHKVTS